MSKKMMMIAVIVCCAFVSIITVNAEYKRGITLAYDDTAMIAVIDNNIESVFHTSIYPKIINRDTIDVYNLAHRKNILNQPTKKKSKTFHISYTYTSYILNSDFEDNSTKWARSEWWNQKMGSTLIGDLYLENGHDLRTEG